MFNTLMYTQKLVEAGFTQEQAEATVNMLLEVTESNLASKQDLKELEYRLIIKLGAIVSVSMTIAVALAKLLS